MTRPLLAALVLALAAVLAPVAGASSAVADAGGGEGGDQGWVPTAPGWLDPGPRGRPLAVGDGLRAPQGHAPRQLRPAARPRRARAAPRGPAITRPALTRLGRRQTDGG